MAETLDDRKVEEALRVDCSDDGQPKGHSLSGVYREVSRVSALNFFIQAMTEKYPEVTLGDLKQNMGDYVCEMIWNDIITENLAANLLQIDVEEVQKQVQAWNLKRKHI